MELSSYKKAIEIQGRLNHIRHHIEQISSRFQDLYPLMEVRKEVQEDIKSWVINDLRDQIEILEKQFADL